RHPRRAQSAAQGRPPARPAHLYRAEARRACARARHQAARLSPPPMAPAPPPKPHVFLLDEWLWGLSPAELEGGMSVVWSLAAQGLAIILVEHVMTAVRALCSRVVVMNAGLKIAEGPPDDVLRNAEVIRAYLGDDDAAS